VRKVQGDKKESHFLGTIKHVNAAADEPWEITLKINDTPLKFEIDCGADVSVITERQYNELRIRPKMKDVHTTLKVVGSKISR